VEDAISLAYTPPFWQRHPPYYRTLYSIEGSDLYSSAPQSRLLQVDLESNMEDRNFSRPLYTSKYTNATRWNFLGQGGLHCGGGLVPHTRQHVGVTIQRHSYGGVT
jgi:hypothetical protein